MRVYRLIERGTELYSVAIYLGGMTRVYLRVKNWSFNAGVIWRRGSGGCSSRFIPFMRIGDPGRPFFRPGA